MSQATEIPVFIIAEAGVNHDGSLEKALQLVDVAADAGADAIKFQTFRTEEITTPDAAKADYQSRQTGEGSQFDMIRTLELDEAAHRQIVDRCAARGIEFMSTPFSTWGIDLLVSLGMRRIKVASGELVNLPLLRDIAGRGLANPCASILSLAMALRYSLGRDDLALAVENAVATALDNGARTADIGGTLGTAAMGDAILAALAVNRRIHGL